MTRRGDLKLSHGATAKARENAVKQHRVQTTNAIKWGLYLMVDFWYLPSYVNGVRR